MHLVGVAAGGVAMDHIAPRVFYNGTYPTEPLSDADHGDFQVNVDVHFIAPAATTGTLAVSGAWPGASASVPVSLPAGASTTVVKLLAKDNAVALWWPAQTPGAQTRYAVNVTFTPAGGAAITDSRLIGFRTLALVTGNDTDPSTLIGRDGQDQFTMRFKVNGADIYSRGANMIPMEEMEGRSSDAAHRRLVQSAVEGGFNTFRLWGGGIFQYDAWYDACDEFGMLIYHDVSPRAFRSSLTFIVIPSLSFSYTFLSPNWHAPFYHNPALGHVRSRQSRPCQHLDAGGRAALPDAAPRAPPLRGDLGWCVPTFTPRPFLPPAPPPPPLATRKGCNECNGHGIYASFVMTTIANEDASRPPWPSCPAHAWTSGVDALWGLPNGSPLGLQPHLAAPAAQVPTHASQAVSGGCGVQSLAAAAALGCRAGDACQFVPAQDYDQGSMGPMAAATSPADCCAKCAARSDCWAATYVKNACWFKTKNQTTMPNYNTDATGCWPAGHSPPPPSPPSCLGAGACAGAWSTECRAPRMHRALPQNTSFSFPFFPPSFNAHPSLNIFPFSPRISPF